MNRYLLVIILGIFLSGHAEAQKVLLEGTILNPTTKLVKIEYETDLLDGATTSYEADLDANGGYVFLLEVGFPTLVNLYYDSSNIKLFVKPGNQMIFNFTSAGFDENISFRGDGEADNRVLQEFYRKIAIQDSDNKRVILTDYPITNKMLTRMKTMDPGQFTNYANQQKGKELDFYRDALYTQKPSVEFSDFLSRSIEYGWANLRLIYPHLRDDLKVNDGYYDFVKEVNIANREAIDNWEYLCFLDKFMNLIQEEAMVEQNLGTIPIFEDKYELAKQFFEGDLRDFVLARLLVKDVSKANFEQLKPIFEEYLDTSTNEKSKKTVARVFAKFNQFSTGAPAPDFELVDRDGNSIKLSDLRGKMVLLSFWASWCKPCITEIQKSKYNKQSLSQDNIVFAYLSVDRNTEVWNRAIDKNEVDGLQLWTGPKNGSLVEKDYEVVSLPQYFLINEQGTFIMDFPKASDPEFPDFIRANLGR